MPRLTAEAKERLAKQRASAARAHERYVQKEYGLEPGEYQRLLEEQDGRCAICRRRPRNRRLAVDHCHHCGAVRGLLCYTCNHEVLGKLEGDPIALYSLSQYALDIAEHYFREIEPAVAANTERVYANPPSEDDLPF